MRVVVCGLYHLGCVTAACLAEAGKDVVGLDADAPVVHELLHARPPMEEPKLADLVAGELRTGRLTFTTDARLALKDASVVWITFDTPVNEHDEADVAYVRARLDAIADAIEPGTLVMISSQVPVGFTRKLMQDWAGRDLKFAYSPENLRLGKAIEVFQTPERVIVGLADQADRETVERLFAPFARRFEWMSLESAEMTKHALNAFLATSVTFINELARLCETTGADAKEVERGLKSEARIGPKAYLAPGAAFGGGTLARDVRYLVGFGTNAGMQTPLFAGILASNELHKNWTYEKVAELLKDRKNPTVAILGLAYKPGTSLLRRSPAVELCNWLAAKGVAIRAHDPTVHAMPPELPAKCELAHTPTDALVGADLAVIATEWPSYRDLKADDIVAAMRTPQVVDQNWFLAGALKDDARITYIATGRSGLTKP